MDAPTLAVKGNRSLDLFKLVLDERVVFVSVRVIIGQCLQSLVILSLGNKPTRALGGEENKEELKG